MISKQAKDFKEMLKKNYIPYPDWQNTDWNQVRSFFRANVVLEPLPNGVNVTEDRLGGIKIEHIQVPDATEKVIFHIHGGGMTMGDCTSARFMLSHIGVLSKRNTISVDYRLCPEHTYPAAIDDCAAAYLGLLERGIKAGNIAFLGESAGGMLICALLAYIHKKRLPMPACACVISGSVDPEYVSKSMTENQDTEIVVNLNLRDEMHEYYYKNGDINDPVINPYNSDISDWPPMFFHACKEEILRDESVKMHAKLQKLGKATTLCLKSEMFHTYMMYNLPESYEAFAEIADFFKQY